MSKKYTFRTESENNFDCDSPRSSNCNSAKSKSSVCVHLSHTKDAKTGSSNNNTFVHQVLTSNSNSHSNIAIETLTNDKSYNTSHTSCSSLEEDLYGTSETFNKNLNSIKEKLHELELTSSEKYTYSKSSSRSGSSENEIVYSVNWENSSSESDKPRGYLSSRDADINLDDFTLDEKYSSSLCPSTGYRSYFSNLPITPINELPELEVIEEVEEFDSGSLDYEVPNKKICLRAFTPRFENSNAIPQKSDINLNKGDYPGSAVVTKTLYKNVSSSSSTKSFKPTTSKTLVSNISAFGSDSSSSKKCRYANFVIQDDADFNATNSTQNKAKEETHASNSSSTITSINSQSKSKENFINKNFYKRIAKTEKENFKFAPSKNDSYNEPEEISDLRLDLPSSIVDDSSSYKISPVEPKVIILKKFEGKRRKRYTKSNADRRMESDEATDTSSHSSNISNLNEATVLYKRYCETTPDISSRTNSSPSCKLSSASQSAKSNSSAHNESKVNLRSSASSSSQNNFTKHNIIDSSLIAGLDLPKIGQQNCNFPSITKITIFPEKFTNQACKGDPDIPSDNDVSDNGDSIFTQVRNHYSCYSDKAEMLIKSPTISPVRRVEIKAHAGHGYGDLRPANGEITKCTHFKENSIRKIQSTELSFYNLPSECDSSEDLANNCITVDTTQRTIPRGRSSEKKFRKCCCFIFFSKRNRRFF